MLGDALDDALDDDWVGREPGCDEPGCDEPGCDEPWRDLVISAISASVALRQLHSESTHCQLWFQATGLSSKSKESSLCSMSRCGFAHLDLVHS